MDADQQTLFRVPATIGFADAAAVRHAGERFVDAGADELTMSLAALSESNSMVVATLLAWLRHAREQGKIVRFLDAPEDLRNIMELYGVSDILPLDGAHGAGLTKIDGDGVASQDPTVPEPGRS